MMWFSRKKTKSVQSNQTHSGPLPNTPTVHEQYIGARRFVEAPDAPYQLPKDITDLNRLDFQHFILRQILAGNYVAPIQIREGSTILDVGTGTGRWAIEMAQTFPQARVSGVDLEESRTIRGQTPSTPLNYVFRTGNVLQRLPFNDETFDFVHQRLLVAGIPFARWPEVIRELLRVTKRGGWIELVEGGTSSSKEGPAIAKLTSWNKALMSPAGIDIYNIHKLAPVAQQHGLNCEQRIYTVPVGTWSGRIGLLAQQDLLAVFESLTPRYQQLLGISASEVNTLRQQIIQEWDDLHYQLSVFVFYGQKRPFGGNISL